MSSALLDRRQAPPAGRLVFPQWPSVERVQAAGGQPVFLLPYGLAEVAEVQLVFDLGAWNEGLPGLASFTGRLLTEGTSRYSGPQIAERLDELGAFFNVEASADFLTASVSVLSRNLRPALELIFHTLGDAQFPEDEYELQLRRNYDALTVDEQKTSWQARRACFHRLFGPTHPYGSSVDRDALDAASRQAVLDCHRNHFGPERLFALAAGRFNVADVLEPLNAFATARTQPAVYGQFDQAPQPQYGRQAVEMPRQMQASIRVGQLGFERSHPDLDAMRLVNMILGGYFGSRLMSNIREDKGYTYGIGSAWATHRQGGYLTIATDVGSDYVEDTFTQIRVEVDRMLQEPVPADELETARNYLLGRLISDLETPFQVADRLKYQWVYGLPDDEWSRMFAAIQALTSEDLLAAARKHLRPDEWVEVVAGPAES